MKHSHLWNDLPEKERKRLMPYEIECQMLHLEQARAKVVRAHNKCMKDFDDQLKNLQEELDSYDVG